RAGRTRGLLALDQAEVVLEGAREGVLQREGEVGGLGRAGGNAPPERALRALPRAPLRGGQDEGRDHEDGHARAPHARRSAKRAAVSRIVCTARSSPMPQLTIRWKRCRAGHSTLKVRSM